MKVSLKASLGLVALGAAAGVGAVGAAQGGLKLTLNGKVASSSVRMIEGRPYAPLADVARGLGMVVVKRPGGFEITPAGGANQVEGLRGKVGDTLFDGKWRFQVLSIQTADSYVMKTDMDTDYAAYRATAEFDVTSKTFTPLSGNTLYVVQCRARNAVKENQALYVYQPFTRTALTDNQGNSYPPIGYDMQGARFQSKPLLPGSGLDFAVLFTVPEGTTLKDLVFTLRTIAGGLTEGKDVRVSLTQ